MERRRWLRLGAALAGLALLAAAVAFAAAEFDWQVLREAEPAHLLALAALVAINLALTGLLFCVVTRNFDLTKPVGPVRMTALIAASMLVNYLPLPRMGLVGRTAYLKARHGLAVRQSAVIVAVVVAVSLLVLGLGGAVLYLLAPPWRWWVLAVLLLVATLATEPIARRVLGRSVVAGWLWVPLRTGEMLVAAARLWVALAVVGVSIGFAEAMIAAVAGVLARVAGITPNGLGVSEWVIAGVVQAISPIAAAEAAAAALVNRAAEVLVLIPAGLGSIAWLRK